MPARAKSRKMFNLGNGNSDQSLGSNDAINGMSVLLDAGESTNADDYSHTNMTVASTETAKATNTNEPQQPASPVASSKQTKNGNTSWNKLKRRFISNTKKVTNAFSAEDGNRPSRTRSTPVGRRWGDGDHLSTGSASPETARLNRAQQRYLDVAIRGRLDGLDIISLGPAHLTALAGRPHVERAFAQLMSPERLTKETLVRDMMWTSSGKVPPEMVFEGYFPGGGDRWTLRMDVVRPRKDVRKDLTTTTNGSDLLEIVDCSSFQCEDGIAITALMESMWGKEQTPPPTHQSPKEGQDELELLQQAAANSVPIDIDENTFIIDAPDHLRTVHDIASGPLKRGDFDSAIVIFRKILKGFQTNHSHKNKAFLIGQTLHNIGLVQMWQSKFEWAAESFRAAYKIRKQVLPANHSDTGVSLLREGIARFACGQLKTAIRSLNEAMPHFPEENMSKAILLNNLGVVHYHRDDIVEALRNFTLALEIQRGWLDNKIRRETLVFDVSTTLANMGKCYLDQKDYESALFVYEEALLLRTTVFKKDHECVLESLSNFAHTKARSGDTKKAIRMFSSMLRTQEAKYGLESQEAIVTMGIIGHLHGQRFEYAEAVRSLESVYQWQKSYMEASHPAVLQTARALARFREKMDNDGSVSMWI